MHPRSGKFQAGNSYQPLEPRQLLAGMFSLESGTLKLNFVDEASRVVITQDETDYKFILSEGEWSGQDGNGITGNGSATLRLEHDAIDQLFSGISFDESFTPYSNQGTILFHNVDLSPLGGNLFLRSHELITQTPGSQLNLNRASFTATNTYLPVAGNTINQIEDIGGNLHLKTGQDLHVRSITQAGNVSIQTEGNLDVSGSFIQANHLRLASEQSLNVQSFERFEVGTLSVAGADILVKADTDWHEDEIDFVTILRRLQLDSAGDVDIRTSETNSLGESSLAATRLVGTNHAENLTLNISGQLYGSPNSTIVVDQDASLTATNELHLGHHASSSIMIGGAARLTANQRYEFGILSESSLSVGEPGHTEFGSLDVFGSNISIHEDGRMRIESIRGERASLNATSSIFNTETAELDLEHLRLVTPAVVKLGEFAANRFVVDTLKVDANRIFLGGDGATFFTRINIQADGPVAISEDDSIIFVGDNYAESMRLTSAGSIFNATSTSIETEKSFHAFARERIRLANMPGDSFEVGGKATLNSRFSTIVGLQGTANFLQLSFETAYAHIRESSGMHLVDQAIAIDFILASDSYISDGDNLDLFVTRNARFQTPLGTLIGDSETSKLSFCQQVEFQVGDFAVVEDEAFVTIDEWFVPTGPYRQINIDARSC